MPDYCQANKYPEIIEATKKQFTDPTVNKINLASANVLRAGGYDWTRVQQCIEFAKEMKLTKVGLAVCVGLFREGQEFARLLNMAGIEIISVACLIGGIEASELGIPDGRKGNFCNPIAQAELMNKEDTQFNFILGLCIGHDTLFIMHSKAPVTYVVVKDQVMGNNPGAALISPYWRMKFSKLYGEGDGKFKL
jgi:uncharacterized metal-binding protein